MANATGKTRGRHLHIDQSLTVVAPLRIAVLLFPALTALDVFGPLTALNLLSIQHPMTLSLLSTDLEPVSIDRTIIGGAYQGTPSWMSQVRI